MARTPFGDAGARVRGNPLNAALLQEIAAAVDAAPDQIGFVAEMRNPQPHSHLLLKILKGPRVVAVAKLARSGSGSFFLRRERLITEWLNRAVPRARAVVPVTELDAAPRGGLLYPFVGLPVTTIEAGAWMRSLQEATARPARDRGLGRALLTRRAVCDALSPEARRGFSAAWDTLAVAVTEGRLHTVARHGDLNPGNILEGGVIDWGHFRRCSLAEYDALYLALVRRGYLDNHAAVAEGASPVDIVDEVRRSTGTPRDLVDPPPASVFAAVLVSAAELSHQSQLRSRIGLAYGAPPPKSVNDRLSRLADTLSAAFLDSR